MSFFEKLKNLHSGPPAIPKRIDTNAGRDWSEDEFDEEGDTYEAPPCERPTIKVQHQHVEENVYLGYPEIMPPNPVILQRAAPPPRPVKSTLKMKTAETLPVQEEFHTDPSGRKCLEVSHKDGTNKKSNPKKSPPVILATNQEEDVYLDPNEGQSEKEQALDVYVEPTTACSPIPHGIVRMLPPKNVVRDLPPSIMKPPVPRVKTNSSMTSDSLKAVSTPAERRGQTSHAKVQLLIPNIRPPLPVGNKEYKPSPPTPPLVDLAVSGMHLGGQRGELQDEEWFAGLCGRKAAEDTLLRVNKDGSFMVRCSTAQNTQQPFTLVVLFNQKVYNIPVRFLKNSGSYALGKEGKKNEELFVSLQEMISHHKDKPLLLIDSKSQAKHTTYLTYPVQP